MMVWLAIVTVLVPGAALSAQAQRGRGGDQMSAAELIRTLDSYALIQAQETLQLSDTQYSGFVTRLKRLQELRRRNQQARNQILQELRRLAGPQAPLPVNAALVSERLKALRAHDDKAAAELRAAYDALDEVLDPRQQARFRLFEEQLERRKLDLIMRARQGARGR
jgi:hypothetical protein